MPNKMDEGGVSEIDYKNAREFVLSTYSNVKEYEFDKENELWCKLTFDVSSPDAVCHLVIAMNCSS